MEYVTILYFILTICKVENSVAQSLAIYPESLNNLTEGFSTELVWKFLDCSADNGTKDVRLTLLEGYDNNLHYPQIVHDIPCGYNETYGPGVNTTITGNIVGFVKFQVTDLSTDEEYGEYTVGITRPPEFIADQIFLFGSIILVIALTFTFGLTLDMDRVVQYLKKPIAPGIGLACQFVLMPMIAYLITLAMTTHNSLKLGVFSAGVAPGGGLSNIWVYLVNGDVDLSITMTFVSTVASLGFIPLWMYTLGQHIIGDTSITLDFLSILQSLAVVVLPLIPGILINRYLPKVSKYLKYMQAPLAFIASIFTVAFNIYANLYAFKMVFQDYQLVLVSMVLPYAGAIFGFLIALALKQGKSVSITIAIETAIQNGQVSFVILKLSLPQPWADMSAAIPVISFIFIMFPFAINVIVRQIYLCYKKRKGSAMGGESESIESGSNSIKMDEKLGVENPAVIDNDEASTST